MTTNEIRDQSFPQNPEQYESTVENYKGQGGVSQWKNDMMAMQPLLAVTKEELLRLADIPSEIGEEYNTSPVRGRVETNFTQAGNKRNSSVPVSRVDPVPVNNSVNVKKPDPPKPYETPIANSANTKKPDPPKPYVPPKEMANKNLAPQDYTGAMKDMLSQGNASTQAQPQNNGWKSNIQSASTNLDSPQKDNQPNVTSGLQNKIEQRLLGQKTSNGYVGGYTNQGITPGKSSSYGQGNGSFKGNFLDDGEDAIEAFKRALEEAQVGKDKRQPRDDSNTRGTYGAYTPNRGYQNDYSQDRSFDAIQSYKNRYLGGSYNLRKDLDTSMDSNDLKFKDMSYEWPYSKRIEWLNKRTYNKSPYLVSDQSTQDSFLKVFYSGGSSLVISRDEPIIERNRTYPKDTGPWRLNDPEIPGMKPYASNSRSPGNWYNH